jgi:ribosome assembly protein YihI (activator of Der GTPase)
MKKGILNEGTLGYKATARKMKLTTKRTGSAAGAYNEFKKYKAKKKTERVGSKQPRGTPLDNFINRFAK